MGVRYSGPLVGRGAELERLDAALARASQGSSAVVLVGGEAGVGKSRLAAEAAARARAAGMRVLSGACVQIGEEALPFAPFSDALRPLIRSLDPPALDELVGEWRLELARLLPDLGRSGPVVEVGPDGRATQARLFELVLRLLERLADKAPLALMLEDLHWSDRSSLELLAFIAHGLRETPALLLATYRTDELHRRHRLRPVLADLDRNPAVERFELRRLDRDELAELLAARLGHPPRPDLVERIMARSEGNPLFAEELLATRLRGEGEALPGSLHDLLVARIEALPEHAQQVLRLIATTGRGIRHGLLAAASPLDQAVLLAAVREAVAGQVLVVDGDGYSFRHALLQEAVEADLLPGERCLLHGTLARTLSAHPELGSDNPAEAAAEIAVHWHAAGDQHQALLASVEAGRRAEEAFAFAEARSHYERALELWAAAPAAVDELARAEPPVDRVALLQRAAEASHLNDDGPRAVTLARAALAAVDAGHEPVRAGLLNERLGRYLWTSGGDAALDVYQRAVDLVPAEPPSAARAKVLAGQAHLLLMLSRLEPSRDAAAEALAAAQAAGARREEARALVTLGSALDALGQVEGSLAQLREARRLATTLGDPDLIGLVYTFLPQVLDLAGQLDGALAEVLDGVEAALRRGVDRSYGVFLNAYAGELCFRLGRWDEADRHSRRALDLSRLPGVGAMYARFWRASLEVERGELAAAAQRLDEVERYSSRTGSPQFVRWYAEVRAALALWEGRLDDAVAAVRYGLERVAGAEEDEYHRGLLVLGLRAAADRAEQARARRLPTEAGAAREEGAALLDRLRELAGRAAARGTAPQPTTVAQAALGEAEATRMEGRPDPARWAAAAAAWERLSQPYQAAYARWREAEALLAARGQRAPATAALRQAYEISERLGAAPLRRELELLAQRARIDLVETAATPAGPQAEPSPAERLGLTRREREVLVLVAAGRTNRQIAEELFISVKTAGIHVSNILAKLGVASRVEAATVAHRGGLVDEPAP